jgi:hypothetical protein
VLLIAPALPPHTSQTSHTSGPSGTSGTPPPPRHVQAAGLACVIVLLLHVLALDAMAPRVGPAMTRTPSTMQVRQIMQSQPISATQAATQSATHPVAQTSPTPEKPTARPRLKAGAAPAAPPAALPRAIPATTATEAAPQPVPFVPLAAPADAPIPTYATSPAPAATLVFDVRRGLVSGQSTLSWRPENGAYTVAMNNEAFGVGALSWASRGVLDADGLAPERYSEIRNRREVRSTNFQRDVGKLSFSAQSHEYPLTPGLQDRVSWMLQLAAVLQANPHLSAPGARLTLAVVGTRGAPEPWVFTVQDSANERSSEPTVANSVHLLREPRRPYDLRVNIWLDPARYHLPVRAQLLVHATGEGHEFNLSALTWY